MKAIYKILSITLAGIMTFVACDDDVERSPSPEVPEGCQGVFFPAKENKSAYELAPEAATEITLTVARTATDAVTVPIKAEVNEQSIFTVPESVSFAAGETTKEIKVTFPTAKEGTTYTLKLKVEGDAYANAYATENSFLQTTVTRIKWEKLEPGVMVEGLICSLFGAPPLPVYVEMDKAKLGSSTRYRLINPYRLPTIVNKEVLPDDDGIYDGYPYNEPSDMVPGEYLMIVTVNESGSVSVAPFQFGVDWGYGMMSGGSFYGYLTDKLSDYPLGTIDGEIISFPSNSLYFSMVNFQNGRAFPGKPTTIYLTKEAYLEANSAIKDHNEIEYEDVEGAISAFESAAFTDEWDQLLQKAIDIKPNKEDSPYKNLYYLPDLYSEGFGLAFYFSGEKITIPANQPTGLEFLGNEIFVSPSTDLESGIATTSSGLQTYTFGLKFHTEDKEDEEGLILGEFAETFFFSENEIKRSIEDFCGNFTLNATSVSSGEALEYPVKITKGSDNKTLTITGLIDPASADGSGYKKDAVTATFDADENCVILSPQSVAEKFVYGGAEYNVLFRSYSYEEDNIFDDQSIRITCRYNDVLQFTSDKDNTVVIDGFGYYAVGLNAVINNMPYNISLIPALVEEKSTVLRSTTAPTLRNMTPQQGANRPAVVKQMEVEKKTLSFDNFSPRPKAKKESKRTLKLDVAPIF